LIYNGFLLFGWDVVALWRQKCWFALGFPLIFRLAISEAI